MNWIWKALAQKGLGLLPFSHRIHPFLQRHIFRTLRINDFFLEDRLTHVSRHLQAWQSFHDSPVPPDSFELGAGWYPIVPTGMYLCGVPQQVSTDLHPLLTIKAIQELDHWLLRWQQSGKLQGLLPQWQEDRWQTYRQLMARPGFTLAEWQQQLNIRYLTGDARQLPLPGHSVSLVHSNNTFEHIPASTLLDLLQEMKRLCKPSGVMSHYIDMADHYSYGDPKLSPFHFLRFTEKQWHWIENRLQSQNRLRINQYRTLYEQVGIPIWKTIDETGSLPADLSLAPPFEGMPTEEVAVLYSQFISQL